MINFPDVLAHSLEDGTALRIVLSRKAPRSKEPAERVTVRPVSLGDRDAYQVARTSGRRETHENISATEAKQRVQRLFGEVFLDCHLFTPQASYTARITRRGEIKVTKQPASMTIPSKQHDRSKQHVLVDGVPCPFLIEMGVMTPGGKVRARKQKKFRQVNRFLELVGDMVHSLPAVDSLRVVDFGCGKSYLTFALHYLLTEIHGRRVDIIGLDEDPEIIRQCQQVARRLGCRGLEFRLGHIAEFDSQVKMHLAVSLHACDTATDDALAKAVHADADVILAVPCCQHELAAIIHSPALEALEQYGLLKERLAALSTDALRAMALEICGYRTQVVEFIDTEHTAKNVLIRAVRRQAGEASPNEKTEAFRKLKDSLGIEQMYLEELLGKSLASAARD